MKNYLCLSIGMIASLLINLFGGWDSSIVTLLIFMAIDYITGLIVAGVFHKSKKTNSGALKSNETFKGLAKKGMVLFFVIIGTRIDILLGTDYVRDSICIAFIINELISITENAGLMGLPIPKIILNSIEVLKNKEVESYEKAQ